jgi:acetyl esterase/lipase
MNTRGTIDPELLAVIEQMPVFDFVGDLPGCRKMIDDFLLSSRESFAHPDVVTEERHIPGPAGAPEVPLLIYRPRNSTGQLPALLDVHGGGYVAGIALADEPGNIRTANELGCVVVAPDYRLSPEARAPAAVEDCYAALAWMHDNADELGIDRGRVAIGGASAGGGLAAALCLLARDRAAYPVCFQMLIYPMLDDRTSSTRAASEFVGEVGWKPEQNRFGWQALLGHEPGVDGVSPYAAPARASDLAGLPPTYISCGALDLFADEDIDYARRLLAAGVPTELHIYPGAFHGYEFAAQAAVSIASERERRVALARAFGVTPRGQGFSVLV